MTVHSETFDVVVYGSTGAGIAAAVSAARKGQRVALVEYQRHLGGMSSSGLGKADVETRGAIGGLFREFVERIESHYARTYGPEHPNVKLCDGGYYYEPSVAERVLGRGDTKGSVLL
ncbi:MAG: FAD-dependent oxidoreductase, partial [Verrucomicrobiota bacterium]